MTESKQSTFVKSISNGFYRISQVITAGILVAGIIIAFTSEPRFSKTYRYGLVEQNPVAVENCSEGDIKEYAYSYENKTPKGHGVSVTLCFKTLQVTKNGTVYNYLPYSKTGNDYWYIESYPSRYGSDLSSKYLANVMKGFSLPQKDAQDIDNDYWKGKMDSIFDVVKGTAIALLCWVAFFMVIRFIWRGFTNKDEI